MLSSSSCSSPKCSSQVTLHDANTHNMADRSFFYFLSFFYCCLNYYLKRGHTLAWLICIFSNRSCMNFNLFTIFHQVFFMNHQSPTNIVKKRSRNVLFTNWIFMTGEFYLHICWFEKDSLGSLSKIKITIYMNVLLTKLENICL